MFGFRSCELRHFLHSLVTCKCLSVSHYQAHVPFCLHIWCMSEINAPLHCCVCIKRVISPKNAHRASEEQRARVRHRTSEPAFSFLATRQSLVTRHIRSTCFFFFSSTSFSRFICFHSHSFKPSYLKKIDVTCTRAPQSVLLLPALGSSFDQDSFSTLTAI